jgi:hypothetical protein
LTRRALPPPAESGLALNSVEIRGPLVIGPRQGALTIHGLMTSRFMDMATMCLRDRDRPAPHKASAKKPLNLLTLGVIGGLVSHRRVSNLLRCRLCDCVPVTAILGYARVSTTGQDLGAQLVTLAAAGVEPACILTDKLSGSAKSIRPCGRRC